MRRGRLLIGLILALGLAALAGCGRSGPRRVPVTGQITLDGKPLDGCLLLFNPDNAKGNMVPVSCSARAQGGRYDLQTTAIEARDSGPGAPPGWYKVTLKANLPGMPQVFPGPVLDIDRKYLDAERTPLVVEVVEAPDPNAYNLNVTHR